MKPISKLIHCKHCIGGRRDNLEPMYRCEYEKEKDENWYTDNCTIIDYEACPRRIGI